MKETVLGETTWSMTFLRSIFSKRGLETPKLEEGDYIFRVKGTKDAENVDVQLIELTDDTRA